MFILIGIVLFAALGMTVSRGFQSSATSNLSKREAELAASEIMAYAQSLERAINRMRRNGCSENDISFANDVVSGYEHTPAAPDKCKFFHGDGGKIGYRQPKLEWLDSTHNTLTNFQNWYFTNTSCIPEIGDYQPVDCHLTTPEKNFELFMVLKYLDGGICEALNKSIHNDKTIRWDGNPMFSKDTKFTGDFSSPPSIRLEGAHAATSRCMTSDSSANDEPAGAYHFYHVLIAR